MRHIIYGAGGIGGAIGGRLLKHGREVVLIARGEHLDRMRSDGLRLVSPSGSDSLDVPVAGHPSEIDWRQDDVVILTMKSQHTQAALEDLRIAAGDVAVVCAQNGVANERMAARMFTRVYGMVVVLPAVFLEPGIVMINADKVGGVLDCGLYPAGVDPLIEELAANLNDSGFASQPDDDIMRLKYAKLLSNLANAVQALCGTDAAAGDIVREVRSEALAVYDASGIKFSPEDLGRRSSTLDYGQIEGQPRQGGSSWQSLARGAGSIETDFLNGEISLLGTLHGVSTPYNRMLQETAAEAVRQRRAPGSYSVEELVERAERHASVGASQGQAR